MTVLDDEGYTVCNANLELKIKNQELGIEEVFSTTDGTIKKSLECGPKNVTYMPDYYTYYNVAGPGVYQLNLIAITKEGTREISDSFEIREQVPFDVERIGPTRIYPPATYEMTLKTKANQDFTGKIIEAVPASFEILNSESETLNKFQIQNSNNQNEKQIIWQVDWKEGEIYELKYQFNAPNISPYLYLLGPLKIGDFQEIRQWQIASDETSGSKTAGTVSAGGWSNWTVANLELSDGAYAAYSDKGTTEGTLSNFSFNIPTDAVSIGGIEIKIEAMESHSLCNAYLETSLSWNDGTDYTVTQRSPDDPGELAWEDVVYTEGSSIYDWDTLGQLVKLMITSK